ncbi:MAG: hypothetical protein J0H60_14010 [Rhizobiales bacterium]|nr:hypothetical protein [Hyphomicrobiales bacterium]
MDIITPADRALIDAAIAAGRVRKIPRGVSGIDPATGYGWQQIGAVMRANDKRAKRISSCEKPQPVPVARAATSEGIDKQIRAMRRQGMTYDAIAASLGMYKSNVWQRCRKMQLPS